MQIFRAYLQDATGTITWAAWIEAAGVAQAGAAAEALRPGQVPTLDLWWTTPRELAHGGAREPV